jgi:hypothetical protein
MLFPIPFPFIVRLPIPVTDVRDRWDWLALWCTVGAVALALVAIGFSAYAIRRGNRIARDGDKAIVRERRNVFELGVLVRVIEVCSTVEHGAGPIAKALLATIPNDMPGLRAEVEQGRVPSNEALLPFLPEYHQAVQRRLEDR